jgi:hypothetical protein
VPRRAKCGLRLFLRLPSALRRAEALRAVKNAEVWQYETPLGLTRVPHSGYIAQKSQ